MKKQVTVYGEFPSGFGVEPLQDLCTSEDGIQTGPFGSQLHQRDYVEVGTPIITVEHLGDNHILHEDIPYVSESDKDRLSKYLLRPGDIVFSRVGSVDRRALVSEKERGWLFSGRCLRVRPDPNKIHPGYLSYFFGLQTFKEYIRSIAVGATMPSLNTQILSEVPVPLPTIPEQQAIAHILGTLDDKIQLNRRMNQSLKMARAIFKDWFVNFGPTRAKMEGQEPYLFEELWNIFPSELVDSELRGIPDGWAIETLDEMIELAYGKALKAGDRKGGPIPVYGSNGQVGWHDEKMVSGPGIIVGRKGNPGTVTWSHDDFFPIDTAFYVVPLALDPVFHFLYYALIYQHLPSVSADSAVPGLNRNLAYMNKQVVPNRSLMEIYDSYVEAMFLRMQQFEMESLDLTFQRNSLLEKLVSGEITIGEK